MFGFVIGAMKNVNIRCDVFLKALHVQSLESQNSDFLLQRLMLPTDFWFLSILPRVRILYFP